MCLAGHGSKHLDGSHRSWVRLVNKSGFVTWVNNSGWVTLITGQIVLQVWMVYMGGFQWISWVMGQKVWMDHMGQQVWMGHIGYGSNCSSSLDGLHGWVPVDLMGYGSKSLDGSHGSTSLDGSHRLRVKLFFKSGWVTWVGSSEYHGS